MQEHTSGPWRPILRYNKFAVATEDDSKILAGDIDSHADARMMAAAPALLYELEWILHRYSKAIDPNDATNARIAIRDARVTEATT